jgi:alkaline phosphatase
LIKVVLGGGRSKFLPNTKPDYANANVNGTRVDNRDLIEDWKLHMERLNKRFKFVWNASDFRTTDFKDYDHVLGLFIYLEIFKRIL